MMTTLVRVIGKAVKLKNHETANFLCPVSFDGCGVFSLFNARGRVKEICSFAARAPAQRVGGKNCLLLRLDLFFFHFLNRLDVV